ncbi:hypothetical protein ACU4GD_01520 [Cupriavidus basilensis]
MPTAQGACALGADDVILMASPMLRTRTRLYVRPDDARVMLRGERGACRTSGSRARRWTLIRQEGVSFTMASTPFLTDLARTVTETGDAVPHPARIPVRRRAHPRRAGGSTRAAAGRQGGLGMGHDGNGRRDHDPAGRRR